ncbi:tenascin-like [Oppia nitens]|uniref:tenascin-like n=1 Tax=Oppia nitens TaxID=1686743 RepID=UPI0023DCCAC6|nr:tenascin-like [Oppia nitens]
MKYLSIVVFVGHLLSIGMSQTQLTSCDYQKYTVNGCEDEMGADCDQTSQMCRCKPGNWYVIDKRFCFPQQCPKHQYYDHNFGRCEPQRVGSLNSELNYCRYDFHCKGEHVRCLHTNEWNYRCVCDQGFTYDSNTQECQLIRGFNGFCVKDIDCNLNETRNLICVDKSCQCSQGFTYSYDIDGCEDNEHIKERDSQARKMIYLFIGLGLFFGTALSLKFGTNSGPATQQLLLKRLVEQRQKQHEQQLHKTNEETESFATDIESNATSDGPINSRETA